MDADVVDDRGRSVRGAVGELVIRKPWPGMTRGFWRDPPTEEGRYFQTYWSRLPNTWVHGDWARIDDEGYWYIEGRSDDTLKIAGKRVGPAEVESAAVAHPAVSEAAAIGVPHEIKGEAIVVFVVPRPLHAPTPELARSVQDKVAEILGKPLRPEAVRFVTQLPKTRNAKILRRVIRGAYLGKQDLGDLSSLENPAAIEEIALLSGNWIFAAKQAFDQPQPEAQIWAVPIAGGTPKLAFAYVVPGGGIPEAPIDNAPYLRRQFSPDGRRMVIAVNGQLVVVDLESGAARALGVKGTFPSWSRDGSRLAFLLTVPNPNAIGPDVSIATVAADGGAVHELGLLTQAEALEWSVDGMNLLVPQQGRVSIVDVASGAVTRTIDFQSGPAPSFAHFRRGTPAVALALFGCVASRSLIS